MRLKPAHWIAIGFGMYVLFALVRFPAEFVLARLGKSGVSYSAASGTLWHGQVLGLQAGTLRLGDGEWTLHPLALLSGKLSADVKFTLPQGFVQAGVSATLSGLVTLHDLSGSLPINAFTGGAALPGGWVGMAQGRFSQVSLDKGWPTRATGTLDVTNITGPASEPVNLGSYRLTFTDPPAADGTLTGKVQDLEAAISVSGNLKLMPNRSYELSTMVAPTARTPESLKNSIQYLGEADAQGKRTFTASGTL